MRGKVKRDVVALKKEWTPEQQRQMIEFARGWVGGQGAWQNPDQQITAWFNYYAAAAERINDDLTAGNYKGSHTLEQQRQLREVASNIKIGKGHWDKRLPNDAAQRGYAMRYYNKYQEDQRSWDDGSAWEVFAAAVETAVSAIQREYEIGEREREEARSRREEAERARISQMVKGSSNQADIDFALKIEAEINGRMQSKRVICQLIAPNAQKYRASTTEGFSPNTSRGIPHWIMYHTEPMMPKPEGGLRQVSSCTEFKCLIRYMHGANIDDSGIDDDSTVDEVRALLGANGYTIAREIEGVAHRPKIACDNCRQWLTAIGWSWADGYQ